MKGIWPWILFAAVVILQLLDIGTTITALKRGAVEANKLMIILMDKIGVLPALILTKAALIAGILAAVIFAPSVYLTAALGLIAAFYVGVVINNYKQMNKGA